MSNYLEGIIDRFEEEYAVVKLEDGQTIDWPLANLPEDLGEGEAVKIFIKTDTGAEEPQENRAKEILNTLLKKS